MPPRNWKLRIEDILECITKIDRYTEEMTFDSFRHDEKTIDAIIRNLTVIGEAVQNIPAEVLLKYPNLPWAQMRGIRNVVVHEYFGVSIEILWQTIQNDLPTIVPALQNILFDNK